jgi:putative transposase
MIREGAETGEIYHIYNRGVEKRVVFEKDADRIRFIHDLFEFNDSHQAKNTSRSMCEVGLRTSDAVKPRKQLVDILAWCLMPNHFHLLLRQKTDGGITTFMRKLGTGYTNAFNLKKDRVGPLFQGKFKIKHVSKESHLLHLPHYIHLNPLDLLTKDDATSKNLEGIISFLENYRWSSFRDYCNKKNFPSLIDLSFANETFGSPASYHADIISWMKEGNNDIFEDILLD